MARFAGFGSEGNLSSRLRGGAHVPASRNRRASLGTLVRAAERYARRNSVRVPSFPGRGAGYGLVVRRSCILSAASGTKAATLSRKAVAGDRRCGGVEDR